MTTTNAPSFSKVVLITGGTSGLGRSMCERLAATGHRVYGTGRQVKGLETLNAYHMVGMDVTDTASVNAAVALVLQDAGRIDVLINNAGLGIQGPVEDIDPELAHQVMNTNVYGPHRMMRAVLPAMRAQGSGVIINISSIAANFGLPYRGFYSASKAALDRLSEALSTEVARFGIQVVTVQPGEFNTNIATARLRPKQVSEAHRPGYEKAMEVLGGSMHYSRDPDELARVIARIIASPRPRTVYRVAEGVQKMSVLLKKLLPGRMFERMVRKHYE
ncbi:MAG: SDR family oxidoreductase [Flavobacteriales bacterium]|jgi:NAD(P)-dependent dehydrogenase (short-subunit alcohol dehydrogenase family)|nr:SDR family oxidoreductase [Flavobacteriales bacterium]MBK9515677.1 SDR family oxidoreductase [Flavobacteriales bacterium]HOZ41423.1 SDR family oxidoreductase [Flavobacteriales bacterium]